MMLSDSKVALYTIDFVKHLPFRGHSDFVKHLPFRGHSECPLKLCETTFKTRFSNHKQSFKFENKRNSTELSKVVWKLKDQNKNYSVTWAIVKEVGSYKCGANICNLCLCEKLFILKADCKSLLNKRSEIISKCKHKNKFLLKNYPII